MEREADSKQVNSLAFGKVQRSTVCLPSSTPVMDEFASIQTHTHTLKKVEVSLLFPTLDPTLALLLLFKDAMGERRGGVLEVLVW